MINSETKDKLNSITNWKKLNQICIKHKKNLNKIIKGLSNNNKIAAYGASARSSTLINFLDQNNQIIKKIFDLNPLKKGLYTPGTFIKIENPIIRNIKKFDVIFLLAWNFKEEIINFLKKIKFKGNIIIPLPDIKLLKLK